VREEVFQFFLHKSSFVFLVQRRQIVCLAKLYVVSNKK